MLAGSNPAARTSQFQSPRSPYRGAGRFFRTRFAGSVTFRRCPIMICGSSLPMPPRLFNHGIRFSSFFMPPRLSNSDMRFSLSHIFPPLVPFSRAAASDGSIRFSAPCPLFGLAGRDVTALSPRVPFPIGGGTLPLISPLHYPPNRLLVSLLATLSAGRLGVSLTIRFPIRAAGRMCIFRARIRFPRRFRHDM